MIHRRFGLFPLRSCVRSRPPKVSTAPCKLATFLAEQVIHGERSAHKGRAPPGIPTTPPVAPVDSVAEAPALKTAKSVLDEEGPEAVAAWVRKKKNVMVTDTTMRDGHQVSVYVHYSTVGGALKNVSLLDHTLNTSRKGVEGRDR